jgi:hypothetical protein
MNRIVIFTLVTLFIVTISSAQQKMNREKIQLLKTSYLTNALNLTPAEAEKFWPVYNLYTDEIQDLRRETQADLNKNSITKNGIENISEESAEEILDNFIALEKNIAAKKIEMILELKNVLSAKKILLLQKAERDFNQRILQEYGQRKRMQGQ